MRFDHNYNIVIASGGLIWSCCCNNNSIFAGGRASHYVHILTREWSTHRPITSHSTDPSLTRISPGTPGSHNEHHYIMAGTIIVHNSGIVIDFSYVISNSTLYRLTPFLTVLECKGHCLSGFYLKVHIKYTELFTCYIWKCMKAGLFTYNIINIIFF